MGIAWCKVAEIQAHVVEGAGATCGASDAVPHVEVVSLTLSAACSWWWILTVLGYGHARLNLTNGFVSRANEAVLPFYILHQPVIIVVAFFVMQMDAGVLVK